MYKLVAFDMDGTIGNTYPSFFRSIQLAMEKNIKGECSIDYIKSFLGISDVGMIKAMAKEKWEKVFLDYVDFYRQINDPAPVLFDGMRDCVLEIKKMGIKLALVTGKCPKTCDITLERFNMKNVFDVIKTGDETRNVKHDSLMEIKEMLIMKDSDVCYVGDDLSDIIESRMAGYTCYSAAWAKDREETEKLEQENKGKVFYNPMVFTEFILKELKN
jgi:phosphoglycolate phosphatase